MLYSSVIVHVNCTEGCGSGWEGGRDGEGGREGREGEGVSDFNPQVSTGGRSPPTTLSPLSLHSSSSSSSSPPLPGVEDVQVLPTTHLFSCEQNEGPLTPPPLTTL